MIELLWQLTAMNEMSCELPNLERIATDFKRLEMEETVSADEANNPGQEQQLATHCGYTSQRGEDHS